MEMNPIQSGEGNDERDQLMPSEASVTDEELQGVNSQPQQQVDQEAGQSAEGSFVKPENHDHGKVSEYAKEVSQFHGDIESQVNRIVQIAHLEGPYHAVEVARKVESMQGSNYLLDRVQEELSKMKEEFRQKGFIQDIK